MILSIKTLSITTLSKNNQHNDTRNNCTQNNDTQKTTLCRAYTVLKTLRITTPSIAALKTGVKVSITKLGMMAFGIPTPSAWHKAPRHSA
jgi:hypothetical protein